MNKSIGKKLADLTNPTFSSISVNSVLYDIVKEENGLGIRTLRCVLVNGSEVTVSTLDASITIKYHESLFNKQFFLSYNKALDAVHAATNISVNISKDQMTKLAKKYIKECGDNKESSDEYKTGIKDGVEKFIEYVFENVKVQGNEI